MTIFPTPQATSSLTFTPPPFDGTLTIPQIYDFHLEHNGEHPLFVYDDNNGESITIRWRRAVQAIHTAARIVGDKLGFPEPSDATPIVAILAVIDQLTYWTLTAGIIRTGYRAFPISPRNSDAGVANLLQKMDVKYLFVSKDQAMQNLANSALARLPRNSDDEFKLLAIPTFATLYDVNSSFATFEPLPPVKKRDLDSSVMILHSSGSTSFPKPIILTHRSMLQFAAHPYYGDIDICGKIFSTHALPPFHSMGVVSLYWASMTGLVLSSFAPNHPPVVPTPDRVYSSAIATKSKLIFCVPTFLEIWAQDPEKVAALAGFDAVLFSGAPVQKAAGDALVSKGVRLYPFYGATEIGGISKFIPRQPPQEGWEYFKLSTHIDPVFVDQESKGDIYQLVLRECISHTPAILNTELSGVKSYDTNDLLIRHPTNPDLWKVYGRVDDQIMHSTGEKTNPVPMETIINRHPMISSSVIFGRGRFQAGILIEPVPHHAFNATDVDRLSAFRNLIWSSIDEANQFAPSHSRIFKEMILVAKSSKPFQYTPKGTPRRHIILDAYKHEIEEGYAAIELSSQTDIPIPKLFDMSTSVDFVRKLVEKIMMSSSLGTDDDIFQHGCDSLQAAWIRNTILHALGESSKVDTEDIPTNFVYLNPTIGRLGNYVAWVANGSDGPDNSINGITGTIVQMNSLVEKYSKDFRTHKPKINDHITNTNDVVLLTGSTGSLGSYILEGLIFNSSVVRVYAFNRRSSKSLSCHARQQAAFEDRGIDPAILDCPRVIFIDGDASQENLGLSPAMYEELRTSVTCIIHNAWRVDFSVMLSSVEPLIAGTRRLIDLALSSPHQTPPRLLFTSSISVLRNWTKGFAPETAVKNAALALGSGYPESKWVAERVLTLASEQTTLRPIIVRIGQLSGGRNGCWNPTEWVPIVVRSGQVLGCLPDAFGFVSWMPIHTAASALVEMRHSPNMFLHLVHPNPISWSSIMKPISEALNVNLVPYSAWLAALEASATSKGGDDGNGARVNIHNPALQLLDFFRSGDKPLPSEDTAEALGLPRLLTDGAVSVAPSLHPTVLSPLGSYDVNNWLQYWKRIGFIDNSIHCGRMRDGSAGSG